MKLLIGICLSIFILTGCDKNTSTKSEAFIKNVDAENFKTLVESGEGIILDVRTPEEVAEGYIQGAIPINFYDENFEQKISGFSRDKEIYVYCKVGGRSSKAAEILRKNGFKKVYHLEKGISEWEEKEYPLVE